MRDYPIERHRSIRDETVDGCFSLLDGLQLLSLLVRRRTESRGRTWDKKLRCPVGVAIAELDGRESRPTQQQSAPRETVYFVP
jgi:hypothetical protein